MTRIPTQNSLRLVPDNEPSDDLQFVPDDSFNESVPTGTLRVVPDENSTPGRQLSIQEVLKIVETDPERAQEAFAKVKARASKPFAERVNEAVGPLGRGAVEGAQDIGNFVVGSVMRGMSYIPGLEGLSDKANHQQRLAALQRAYNQHLNETGTTASIVTPTGAQFTSDVSKTLSQMLLLGGTGRAAGMDNSRRMTGWMAANFGAMDAERSLQVATDAGLTGAAKNAYAAGMGGISGSLTVAFGLAGEKLGLATAEEAISRGAGRAISRLMDRTGLRSELLGMAMEGGEEEAIALSQAVFGSAMGMNSFDEYKQNVGRAFLSGAAVRGVIGSGQRIADKYATTLDNMEGAVRGTLDAQDIREGVLTPDDPAVKQRIDELAGYEDALNSEMESLLELEKEVAQEFAPVLEKQRAVEQKFQDLTKQEEELNALKNDLLEDRNISSPERERLAADLEGVSKTLSAELEATAKQDRSIAREKQRIVKSTADARKVIEEELKRITDAKTGLESELSSLAEGRRPINAQDVEKASINAEKLAAQAELENVTSARRDILQKDREAFGIDRIPETKRQPVLDALERARANGVPSRALEIAQESLATGRVWDSDTHMGVTDRLRLTKDAHRENKNAILSAAPDATDVDSLLARDTDLTNQINTLSRALAANSTDAARQLVSNQFMLSELDSGLVLFRARRAKGGDLSSEEISGIQDAIEKIQRLEAKFSKMKPGDPEYRDTRRELHTAHMELENAQQAPVAKGLLNTIGRGNFLWHTLFTGLDASFVGIHSALPLLLNPTRTAKALFGGVKSAWTEKAELDAFLDLMDRPNGDLYRQGYVTIHGADSALFKAEDLASQGFFKQWSRFDSLRNFVNFWPRTFRSAVNRVRADTFDSLVATNGGRGQLSEAQLRDLGAFVDVITMRGGRGYLDKHASTMNLAFFAPRLYAAQVELLTGRPLRTADPTSRKMIAREYGRLLSRFAALYGAATVANLFANAAGEDDVAEINLNPTDNRFMQIRFGDTWLDPTFRLARWLAFTAQFGTAATGVGTSDKDLGDEEGRKAGRFVTGKFSLPVSTAISAGTKRDIFGREVTREEFLKDKFSPISVQQMTDSIEFYGMGKGTAIGLVQAMGAPLAQDFKSQGKGFLP